MKLFDILRRKQEPFPVVQIRNSNETPQKETNCIFAIDFQVVPAYRDQLPVDTCAVVCGYFSGIGSYSHLTHDMSAAAYADALLAHWKRPVPLILIGSDDAHASSVLFFTELHDALKAKGFVIIGQHRGGKSLQRLVTFGNGTVTVESKNYLRAIRKTDTFNFQPNT